MAHQSTSLSQSYEEIYGHPWIDNMRGDRWYEYTPYKPRKGSANIMAHQERAKAIATSPHWWPDYKPRTIETYEQGAVDFYSQNVTVAAMHDCATTVSNHGNMAIHYLGDSTPPNIAKPKASIGDAVDAACRSAFRDTWEEGQHSTHFIRWTRHLRRTLPEEQYVFFGDKWRSKNELSRHSLWIEWKEKLTDQCAKETDQVFQALLAEPIEAPGKSKISGTITIKGNIE